MPLINTIQELDAAIAAGPFAWPGGYPVYFITDDGAALSFETVKKEYPRVRDSVVDRVSDGWRVIAVEINYEDTELTCAHTNERIPAAYA